jgi:hypothetical protein
VIKEASFDHLRFGSGAASLCCGDWVELIADDLIVECALPQFMETSRRDIQEYRLPARGIEHAVERGLDGPASQEIG